MSKRSEAVKNWRNRTKLRLIEAMGGKCVCCGYDRCYQALCFHHLDPLVKEMGLGAVRANIASWSRIVREVKKCVLVCAVCHLEIHAGFRVVPSDARGFDSEFDEYRKEKIGELNYCPICGKMKAVHLITCSRSCAAKKTWHVDWSKVDLVSMLKESNPNRVGEQLGVSDMAVRKRMKKLGIIQE